MSGRSANRVLRVGVAVALCAMTLTVRSALAHETHQTMSVAEFDEKTRTLQVMIRLESEGLESYLSEVSQQPMFLEDPATERFLARMLTHSVRMLNADATVRKPVWVGMEQEDPWTYVYVEFPIRKTAGLRLSNTVYFDHTDDQVNLLNFQIADQVQTMRFAGDEVWHDIQLPPAVVELTPIAQSRAVGNGPIDMVLIPTHCCDWSIFSSFMERNKDRYTMHAVTLPGMSRTPAPPRPPVAEEFAWIENAVEATAKFIEQEGLERPVILGQGLGGVVAYMLGAEHPGIVGPIITLEAMTARPLSRERITADERRRMINAVTGPRIQRLSDAQWEGELRTVAAGIKLDDETRRNELIDHFIRTHPNVGKRYLIEQMMIDLSWILQKIKAPTLVIAPVTNLNTGRGVPARDIERRWKLLFENAPDNIRLDIWKDTGPFVNEQRPEELDRAIAAFLEQVRDAEN